MEGKKGSRMGIRVFFKKASKILPYYIKKFISFYFQDFGLSQNNSRNYTHMHR